MSDVYLYKQISKLDFYKSCNVLIDFIKIIKTLYFNYSLKHSMRILTFCKCDDFSNFYTLLFSDFLLIDMFISVIIHIYDSMSIF